MLVRILPLILVLAAAGCSRFSSGHPEPAGYATGSDTRITYECQSGASIDVSYPSESAAMIEYDAQTHRMTLAVSASGARYVGGELEWWTKGAGPGSEGTLFGRTNDGTSEILDQCVWIRISE